MKRYGLLAVILIAALVFPTLVGAQGGDTLPGSGWWTGQTIQNVGTAAATIVSTAYDATSGTTYLASSGSVAPGASVVFLPADFSGMPNGFQGSAVVASDQPIKAIVSLTNRKVGSYGVDGGLAGGQYQGIDGAAAATETRFPVVKNTFGPTGNVKSTTMFVQNAGSAPAPVHAVYKCVNGNTYTWDSPNVGTNQMVVLNASAAGVPTGQLCSGTITSAQPIAGVAIEHFATETVATLVQATRGFTPADFASTIYAPVFKKKFPNDPTKGRTTGATVQNVSAGSVQVTAYYYGSSGSCPSGTNYSEGPYTVVSGANYTFLNPTAMPDGCLASAKFVATGGNIVGVVNESYLNTPAPPPGTQSATAYNTLPAPSATNKIVAPLYKEKFGYKTSGLQVQNIGASTATIHVVFTQGTTSWTTVNYTVASGSSQNFLLVSNCTTSSCWVGGNYMPAGSNAGVQVFSDQPILGVISEMSWYPTLQNCYGQTDPNQPCYDKLNYEAFNVTP